MLLIEIVLCCIDKCYANFLRLENRVLCHAKVCITVKSM